jgi:hypothetical protein
MSWRLERISFWLNFEAYPQGPSKISAGGVKQMQRTSTQNEMKDRVAG